MRTVEPRLRDDVPYSRCTRVVRAGKLLVGARCEEAAAPAAACPPRPLDKLADAEELFATQPRCVDSALRTFERHAPANAAARADAAAAYYVRAQRDDRASDLLKALDYADAAPPFNRALIYEALGLLEDARTAWAQAARDESEWGAEAREHVQRLNAVRQVRRDRAAIGRAIAANDVAALARAIEPSIADAVAQFERALPSCIAGDCRAAALLAPAVASVTKDHYSLDALEAARRRQLLPVSRLLRDAQNFDNQRATAEWESQLTAALPAARQYPHVMARIHAARAYVLLNASRYVEALEETDLAIATYERLGDFQSTVITRNERAALLLASGLAEESFRESLHMLRVLPRVEAYRPRTLAIANAASAARALGHPAAALRYQNMNLRMLQADLSDMALVQRQPDVYHALAVAYRERAAIYARLGNIAAAEHDLAQAVWLPSKLTPAAFRTLHARIEEIRGQTLLRRDPNAAAAAFTRALQFAADDPYISFHASVLGQRSDAYRAAHRDAEADADLAASVALLRQEETSALEHRAVGAAEPVWPAYFSRFGDTYRRYIRRLIETGDTRQALVHAERSRDRELLDLLLRRRDTPAAFRAIVEAADRGDFAPLQAQIPAGTFLIEYAALDDMTFVWILSRDEIRPMALKNVTRATVTRWTEQLQQAVADNDALGFEIPLRPAYEQLLAEPVAAIAGMRGGASPRLVIIPDRSMQGLPFAAFLNPDNRRYAIDLWPVTISGSAALYVHSLLRDRALPPGNTALIIANPAFRMQSAFASGLGPLPAAEAGAPHIAALYDGHPVVLVGPNATIPEFLALARHSNVIDVGAHAIVNAAVPASSMLLLAPSANDGGALDAQTLLSRLETDRTRLIVLSACSSAGGAPVGTEGVGPLVRPFIAAGIPAVVGTLWDVGDATAEEVIVSFHREYQMRGNAADALRQAQIEMLRSRNKGLSSAIAWASFQVIGHASSTHTNKEKEPP